MLIARTKMRISKSLKEVFEAVVEPRHMTQYFTSFGSGRMTSGAEVIWKFGDFGATRPFPIKVDEVVDGERISFRWSADDDGSGEWKSEVPKAETSVTVTFERLGPNQTAIAIAENGFEFDRKDALRWADRIEGWVNFSNCLKAYLEHGISLHRNGILSAARTAD